MNISQYALIGLCLLTMAFSACVPVVLSAKAATEESAPNFSQSYAEGMWEASILVQEMAAELEESGWGATGYEIARPQ